ncbi:MAG: TIGR00730 family Rossman fold protein [Nitratiruptor sp.]|nr:TIGR00730 family Rossman fold protein [Nitratiruptor sp.]NPA83340.1 TIGR00730 family Rossman fold protein [Campylobacterota bacterium]
MAEAWQNHPHPPREPNVQELLAKLLASPSYRLAIEDPDFLRARETRPIRLQLDYLKPELIMQAHGIKRTIVVFGSARILERDEALSRLRAIEERLRANPTSRSLLKELRRAEKMVEKSIWYEEAREFGRLVGRSGQGPEDATLTLVTGGGPGIMEAANRGAFDVGAKSVGLNISLPHEQFPNPYITPELCFQFYYFAIRKLHFLHRACAMVVFPGGYGTLDELFEALTLVQTEKKEPIPIVLMGREYWNRLIDFSYLVEEGTISPEDLHLFTFQERAREAWEYILHWYERRGIDLFAQE